LWKTIEPRKICLILLELSKGDFAYSATWKLYNLSLPKKINQQDVCAAAPRWFRVWGLGLSWRNKAGKIEWLPVWDVQQTTE
jgi:hypothetical protein